MAWYKKAFGSAYLDVYSHRDEKEAGKALKLIERVYRPLLEASGGRPLRVLDLCCGQGRYSVLLAGLGHEVAGVDLSGELLALGAEKLARRPELPGRVWLVRADMREVPFRGAFDLAINMFTSFGYFREDIENRRTLEAISCALRRGGKFVIDYLNRNHVIRELVEEDSFEQDGLAVTQSRRISPDGLRVDKTILVEGPQGRDSWVESVRLYNREELEWMLAESNLEVEKAYGDYEGGEYGPDSPRLILTGARQ